MENDLSDELSDPIHDIIDFLIHNDDVLFKSQQIGETVLKKDEKKAIAHGVFLKNPSTFLEKYGKYLKLDHLTYFENYNQNCDKYELNHHIANLRIFLNETKNKSLVKNRRFEALSRMIDDGSYFSETEMMHRNPLLYDQLVGQYMTENEKLARDDIDLKNITLLNVLLEGIDRKNTKKLLDDQKNIEMMDFENSSSEQVKKEPKRKKVIRWGEFEDMPKYEKPNFDDDKNKKEPTPITAPERELLREEFVQEMYRSFLAGEDEDFDYKTIDGNSDYDCIDMRERDEEENYFDSESPDQVSKKSDEDNPKQDISIDESDDELETYMKHLNQHPSLCNST